MHFERIVKVYLKETNILIPFVLQYFQYFSLQKSFHYEKCGGTLGFEVLAYLALRCDKVMKFTDKMEG